MTWNTVSVLCMSQLGSSEWEIQNVFAVFQVGSLLVHCPFPCDVLAVFLVGTPLLAPSVNREKNIDEEENRDYLKKRKSNLFMGFLRTIEKSEGERERYMSREINSE